MSWVAKDLQCTWGLQAREFLCRYYIREGLCRPVHSAVPKLPRIVCLLYAAGLCLFQGAGKRRWSIEDALTSGEEEEGRSVQDIDLRVLADFKEAQVPYAVVLVRNVVGVSKLLHFLGLTRYSLFYTCMIRACLFSPALG